MFLNIPSLEAKEALWQIMCIGASFAGEGGKEFTNYLADISWEHEPENAVVMKEMIGAAHRENKTPLGSPQKVGSSDADNHVSDSD